MRKIGFVLAALLIPALWQGGLRNGWPGASALAASGDTLIVTGDGVNVRYAPSTGARVRLRVYHDQLVTERERLGDWVRAEIAGGDGAEGWIHASLLALPTPGQLARARRRASEPPRAGLPESKPPAPSGALNPAPSGAINPAPSGAINLTPPEPVPPARAVEPPAPATRPQADDPSIDAPPPITETAPAAPPASAQAAPESPAIEPAAGPSDAAEAAELARFRDSVDYLNSRSASVAGIDLFDDVHAVADGVVQVGATDAWSSIPPAGQQSYANTLLDRWAAARGYSGPVAVQIVDPSGKVLLESKKP